MKLTTFDIQLPKTAEYNSAGEEYFFLKENGMERKIMLQDYPTLYNIPHLYEHFVLKYLKYTSPQVLSELLLEQLMQHQTDLVNRKILDIGAGSGMMAKRLKAMGAGSIIGIDIIEEAKNAALRDCPNVYDNYYAEDLANLQKDTLTILQAQNFDCLVCCSALSHIPAAAFNTAYNLLATNGWMAINVMKDFWEDKGEDGFYGRYPWAKNSAIFDFKKQHTYIHRYRTNGDSPIDYIAIIGIKKGQIGGRNTSFENMELSETASSDAKIYHQLVQQHLKGDIKVGNTITAYKSTELKSASYFAKMFEGEYDVQEKILSDKKIIQQLTKISPFINANIKTVVPTSSEALEADLKEHGHVVLRTGKRINEDFIEKLLVGRGKTMEYNRYGTTKRKKVKDAKGVQVTPWNKDLLLPAHNEMTHHVNFPKNMAFTCIDPAPFGGETTIHDCAKAYELLSEEMKEKVTNRNVIVKKRYVADTTDLKYISWKQAVGEGATIAEVMTHFTSIGYECEHIKEEENGQVIDIIEVSLLRPMVYHYDDKTCLHISMIPLTPFWYNQVWANTTPPLRVTWDNHEPLSYEEFHELDKTVLSARLRYDGWRKHDVLVVDNLRTAHGRLPYIGERVMTGQMAQPAQFVQNDNKWEVELI